MKTLCLYFIDALFFTVPIVFCFTLFSLIMLCIRWKTEHRGKHARRLRVSLASLPVIAGLIYGTTWLVFMPLMAREMTAKHDAAAAKRFLETTFVEIGDRSPEFTVQTLSGETIAVPQQGHVTVVTFFATWCGPCHVELPHIQRIWNSRKDNDRLQVIAISREETAGEVLEFLRSNSYTFPAAADTERKIYSQFAAESIPRTFVIAADGTIAHATTGFIDGDEVELEVVLDRLLKLLPEK